MDTSEAKKIVGQSLDVLRRTKIFESLPAALEFLGDEADQVKKKREEVYEIEESIGRLQRDLASTKQQVEEQKQILAGSLEAEEKRYSHLIRDASTKHQSSLEMLQSERSELESAIKNLKDELRLLQQDKKQKESAIEDLQKTLAKSFKAFSESLPK